MKILKMDINFIYLVVKGRYTTGKFHNQKTDSNNPIESTFELTLIEGCKYTKQDIKTLYKILPIHKIDFVSVEEFLSTFNKNS